MISTVEIVVLIALLLILSLTIWYFIVAYKYGQTLNVFSYTRGANFDTAATNGKVNVNLNCDNNREICIEQATIICSGAENGLPGGNSESGPEPIADGSDPNVLYGNFDPKHTVDVTKELANIVNGKSEATYSVDGIEILKNKNIVCPFTYNPANGSGTRPQLIATYTCVPIGTSCQTKPTCTTGPCKSSPCLNGGSCKSYNGTCECICINNYTGSNCQISP